MNMYKLHEWCGKHPEPETRPWIDDAKHGASVAERTYLRKVRHAVFVTELAFHHVSQASLIAKKEDRRCVELSRAERDFKELAEQWSRETAYVSSVTKVVAHPAYYKIIGMGRPAIPMILRRLQEKPEFWFWALTSITREDPVPVGDPGNIRKMTKAWIDWGRERGFV